MFLRLETQGLRLKANVLYTDVQTKGMPLETVDLCFRPGVNPVTESLKIQKLMAQGRLDEITLVGEQQRHVMQAKAGVEETERVGGVETGSAEKGDARGNRGGGAVLEV